MFYRGGKNPGPGGFGVLLRPSQLVRDRIGQNIRAKPKLESKARTQNGLQGASETLCLESLSSPVLLLCESRSIWLNV